MFVLLSDGETYDSVEGCKVVTRLPNGVLRAWEIVQIEDGPVLVKIVFGASDLRDKVREEMFPVEDDN